MAVISVEATPVRRCGHDSCGHNFCGAAPRTTPKFFFFRRGGLGGAEPPQFQSFQKICPQGKFFEMLSWAGLVGRAPQEIPWGGLGGAKPPSGISVTRALPHVRTVKNLKMSPKRRTDLKI